MTKKQLIEALSPFPDSMEVFMAERKTEFSFGLLNSVSKQKIRFVEDPDDEVELAAEDVIILEEE